MKKPVTTNGIKLHINKKKASSFTGLTELEVFEYVPRDKAKEDATIKNLTLNGKKVENFTPENEMYENQVDKFPDFSSINVEFDMDKTATSVVLKDETTHTIRIIVTAENGTERTYTIKYVENQTDSTNPTVPDENESVKPNTEKPSNSDSNQIEKPDNSDSNQIEKPNNDKVEMNDTPTTGTSTHSALLWVVLVGAGAVALKNRKKSK